MRLPRTTLIACLVLCSAMARAEPIVWHCDVVFDATGSHHGREVSIDADHERARDDDMTWTNGARTPGQGNLEQWVHIEGDVASWGNRLVQSGAVTSTFELDLRTGRYTITSTANGQISHGICRGPAAVS